MLENDRGRALAMWLPLNRLLTETDAPFTNAAVPAAVSPGQLRNIVKMLATVRESPPEVITAALEANLATVVASSSVDWAHKRQI